MAAMGAGTALRLARTALFAVVCVAVSGLGHALMSGGPLPLPPLLAVLVPVAAAGWLLARRDRNAPVTVSAHVLGQLGLHAYFTASATGERTTRTGRCPTPPTRARPGMSRTGWSCCQLSTPRCSPPVWPPPTRSPG